MNMPAYADYLYFMNQNFTPYFLFDRRGPVRQEAFFSIYNRQKDYFGFVDLQLQATVYAGQLSANITINPATDLDGAYRVALVLTEDGITGKDSSYAQANVWAGGNLGPMGGFEMQPNPVPAADMKYDYVARSIIPGPEGLGGKFSNLKAAHLAGCSMQVVLDPKWNFDKLNAVVLFIREKDSSILNSKSVALASVGIKRPAGNEVVAWLYPNPSNDAATLGFNLTDQTNVSLCVTDITGRTVYQFPGALLSPGTHQLMFNTETWQSGIYFVTLRTKDAQQTLKLNVLH
jgi:hypothetical protein